MELLKVVISTVYALSMPKFIYIQLFASGQGAQAPAPLKIRADKLEKLEAGKTVIKLGNELVGEFNCAIQGWWIQDE